MINLGGLGYGVAAAAFVLLAGLLLVTSRFRGRGRGLTVAVVISAVWAAGLARRDFVAAEFLLLEAAFSAAWCELLLSVLGRSTAAPIRLLAWLARATYVAVAAVVLVDWLVSPVLAPGQQSALFSAYLLLALIGLVCIEQIYRNAEPTDRRALMHLSLGLGSIFAYNLFLFAHATLFSELSVAMLDVRGVVAAIAAPALALAVRRTPDWALKIFVSRQVVFYSAALLGGGAYLFGMSLVGFYVRDLGGQWGPAIQFLFFAGAAVLLVVVLFSSQARAKLRVFLQKHFYRNKYEYRDEWLRLIATLSDEQTPLHRRALQSLSQLLGSEQGVLWLKDDHDQQYRAVTSAAADGDVPGAIAATHPLLAAHLSKSWIVDTLDGSDVPWSGVDFGLGGPLIVAPLLHKESLLGFACLSRPRLLGRLTYEDIDLLRTVGRQVAGLLAEHKAQEQLSEARQFEAYHRLTAFIVHDLSNLIAQQSLLLRNADRFKDRPEFINDTFATIANSVQRMERLLLQLRHRPEPGKRGRTRVHDILERVRDKCRTREPVPIVDGVPCPLEVSVDEEGFVTVLGHLVRNAQEAAGNAGRVALSAVANGTGVAIEVADNGAGMSEDFVRNRLFKPFDSTKGTKGMGIGAYQAREFVRQAGGELRVTSTVGQGTIITIQLPAVAEMRTGP